MPFRSVTLSDATHDQLVEVLKRKPSRVRRAYDGPEFVLIECDDLPELEDLPNDPECDT